MKPLTMYMLFDPKGSPCYTTLKLYRKDSINTLCAKEQWKEARKNGWTCKKVSVSITF